MAARVRKGGLNLTTVPVQPQPAHPTAPARSPSPPKTSPSPGPPPPLDTRSVSAISPDKDESWSDAFLPEKLCSKIDAIYAEQLKFLVGLKVDAIRLRGKLDNRNHELDQMVAWPSADQLNRELVGLDRDIQELVERFNTFTSCGKEIGTTMSTVAASKPIPCIAEQMAPHDRNHAFDWEMRTLSLQKKAADSKVATNQIIGLLRQIHEEIQWIKAHPRLCFIQRISRIEAGQSGPTTLGYYRDRALRYLPAVFTNPTKSATVLPPDESSDWATFDWDIGQDEKTQPPDDKM